MIYGPHLRVLKKIQREEGPIYLVGAILRQRLKQKPAQNHNNAIQDIDLATTGTAKKIALSFARATHSTLIELDAKHGVYRCVPKQTKTPIQYDFASIEKGTIFDDLARRDCTINSLALSLDKISSKRFRIKSIIDPNHGLRDLKNKTIRCVQEKNITDDPLRMLRFFRAAAEINGLIHPQTLQWISKHKKKIKQASPERIRTELLKFLSQPNTYALLKTMDQTGLLTQIFPVLERGRNLAPEYYKEGGVLGHELKAVQCYEDSVVLMRKKWPKIAKPTHLYLNQPISGGFTRYSVIKLAVLLHDLAKPHTAKIIDGRMRFFGHDKVGSAIFKKIAIQLHFSNDEIELIAKIINAHLRPGNLAEQPLVSERAVYRFFRDLEEDGIAVLLNALADHQSYMHPKKQWDLKEKSIWVIRYLLDQYFGNRQQVIPASVVNGHDVMKISGVAPGPRVGEILEAIKQLQAEGKINNRRDALKSIKQIAQMTAR